MKKENKKIIILLLLIVIITFIIIYLIYKKESIRIPPECTLTPKKPRIITDYNDLYQLQMCGTSNATIEKDTSVFTNKLKGISVDDKIWHELKGRKIVVRFIEPLPTGSFPRNTPPACVFGTDQIDPLAEEYFDTYKDLNTIECIIDIIQKRIEPVVCLEFEFLIPYEIPGSYNTKVVPLDAKIDSHIRVSFDVKNGSHSAIGRDALKIDKNKATMNFAWFSVSTVIHEFLHSIGVEHEHKNGENIKWNTKALYAWALETQHWDKKTVDENILNPLKGKTTSSAFDDKSIMIYYYPPEVTIDGKGSTANRRMSREDVAYISSLYPGGTFTPDWFYDRIYPPIKE